MLLINPYRFAAPRATVSDSDAEAYLQSVEAADGLQLEQAVADAINSFVTGCKSDGIWSAIKASCILAGARSLSGALVPLIGTAPTNNNFVTADYNRESGLKGNRTTKYINSERNSNADPQNSRHAYIKVSEADITTTQFLIGQTANQIFITSSTIHGFRCGSTSSRSSTLSPSVGGLAVSRGSSSTFSRMVYGSVITETVPSAAPQNGNNLVFASNSTNTNSINIQGRSAARLNFYSFGESIDLALLDTRVSTLMTDLASAIP
jgi:hypothetical protein